VAGAAEPPKEIIDFVLDRPFIFVINTNQEYPVFVGVVENP
jgi:serine protease inhibitor